MALFLSANIHQGDELFSVHSRGKQCAFMSLSALLTARNIPLSAWSFTTFNNVLIQGDKMYLRALNNGLLVLDPGVEFLSIDNLPTIVTVNNSFFHTEIFVYIYTVIIYTLPKFVIAPREHNIII